MLYGKSVASLDCSLDCQDADTFRFTYPMETEAGQMQL